MISITSHLKYNPKFASLGSMLLTVGAYTAFCKYMSIHLIDRVPLSHIHMTISWLALCGWYDLLDSHS